MSHDDTIHPDMAPDELYKILVNMMPTKTMSDLFGIMAADGHASENGIETTDLISQRNYWRDALRAHTFNLGAIGDQLKAIHSAVSLELTEGPPPKYVDNLTNPHSDGKARDPNGICYQVGKQRDIAGISTECFTLFMWKKLGIKTKPPPETAPSMFIHFLSHHCSKGLVLQAAIQVAHDFRPAKNDQPSREQEK